MERNGAQWTKQAFKQEHQPFKAILAILVTPLSGGSASNRIDWEAFLCITNSVLFHQDTAY